jgi:hypothetical protein
MCLVGLTDADPTGSKVFLQSCLGVLVKDRQADLAQNATGSEGAHTLVSALASSALVLYLCLSHRDVVQQRDSYMLLSQTIHLAQVHGLLNHSTPDRVTTERLNNNHASISLGAWESWARVESVKRITLCLILLASSLTRLWNFPNPVQQACTDISLPWPGSAFEAGSLDQFGRDITSSNTGRIALRVCEIQEHVLQDVDGFAFSVVSSLAYMAHPHHNPAQCSAADHASTVLSKVVPRDAHQLNMTDRADS